MWNRKNKNKQPEARVFIPFAVSFISIARKWSIYEKTFCGVKLKTVKWPMKVLDEHFLFSCFLKAQNQLRDWKEFIEWGVRKNETGTNSVLPRKEQKKEVKNNDQNEMTQTQFVLLLSSKNLTETSSTKLEQNFSTVYQSSFAFVDCLAQEQCASPMLTILEFPPSFSFF